MADEAFKVGQRVRRTRDGMGSYKGCEYEVQMQEWKYSDKPDKMELVAVGQGKASFMIEMLSMHHADDYELVE